MRALLLLLLLAGCGGTDQREYGTGSDTFRERPLTLSSAIAGFSRASPAFVLDWEGVWIPLDVDEPGYVGARRVKNLYLNSEDPSLWEHVVFTSDNSASIDGDGMLIHHATGQRGSPYFCNEEDGAEPGDQEPSLFASRAEVQVVSGATSDKFSPVGRTNGVAIGSESNNPGLTLDLAQPKTLSQTAQQFERHNGWCQTYLTSSSVARTYRVSKLQFEDLSGAKRPISGEYVPSTDKPGIRWFASGPTTNRKGYLTDYFDVNGIVWSGGGGGVLTEVQGSALSGSLELQLEGEATNRALWNTLGMVGTAVLDGASTTHLGEPPAPMGKASIWTDSRSERLVFDKKDISTDQDQIVSLTTDLSVFRVGESVWLHIPSLGAVGPVEIADSTPHMLRVLSFLPTTAKGEKVGIQRVPAAGDQIVIGLNGGRYHASTVTSVTLPSLPVGLQPANLLHQSMRIDIADVLPWSGGAAGANGNLPVYWAKALPVTIVRGTGATVRLVRDDSTVQAGLGYLLRRRLVLELSAGTDYAMFDLAGQDGPKGLTTASAWVKTVSGGAAQLNLKAHAGGPLASTAWQRLAHTTNNVNGTGQVRMVLPAGAVVRVAFPQVEAGELSSPIVTFSAPATRAATVIGIGSN